ncbi:MAG: Lrp/AsnC family transcriptional regulator [Cytophagaceae bacterium]|jgi:DNA-binding Lrp family transcriptional regulator|nr:Lrp/AsnC family transcriptional regulator [Cytophagaceae bacterium]
MTLDSTDKKLLTLLQDNAKLTTKQLAHYLNLTVTPVFERIKRLEKNGFIKKYVAITDKRKLGKLLTVFCHVSLKEHDKQIIKQFEKRVVEMPEIMECHHIAGEHDYLLKVVTEDMESYHRFVSTQLTAIENISNVNSSFVMNELKYSTAHYLEH